MGGWQQIEPAVALSEGGEILLNRSIWADEAREKNVEGVLNRLSQLVCGKWFPLGRGCNISRAGISGFHCFKRITVNSLLLCLLRPFNYIIVTLQRLATLAIINHWISSPSPIRQSFIQDWESLIRD